MTKYNRSTRGAIAIYRARFHESTPRQLTKKQYELLEQAHFMQDRGVSLNKIETWLRDQTKEVA